MPKSCRVILKKLLFQRAITQDEHDKLERNLKTETQTNADRIWAMGIDSIIEWFCRGRPCGTCPYNGVECNIREWLRAEGENDDNND